MVLKQERCGGGDQILPFDGKGGPNEIRCVAQAAMSLPLQQSWMQEVFCGFRSYGCRAAGI